MPAVTGASHATPRAAWNILVYKPKIHFCLPEKPSSFMKQCPALMAVLTVVSLLTAGCSRNEQASSASELEKAFHVNAAATDPAQPASASQTTPRDQDGQVQQAVT